MNILKYIVIEIQTNQDGTIGNITTTYNSIDEAYSKYYAILSSAAISSIPRHSAIIMDNSCRTIASNTFTHISDQ